MSIISIFLLFSMLAVLWMDVTRYLIPNWLVGLLLLIYPVAVFMAPYAVDWPMAVAAMLGTFAVGYVIFSLRLMGGGDIKLLTACALWTGVAHLADFLFLTAFLGGAFAVLVWVSRKAVPFVPRKEGAKPWPRILREGEPIPYGVAIACAFLYLVGTGKLPVLQG